jgi:hypothetical protein
MTIEPIFPLLSGPPAIPIHDDGNMRGQLLPVYLTDQSLFHELAPV